MRRVKGSCNGVLICEDWNLGPGSMVGLGLGDLYYGRSDICLCCRRDCVKTQTPELFVRKEVARDGRSWSDCVVWVATTGPKRSDPR